MKRWFILFLLIVLAIFWFMHKGGIFIDGVNPFLKEKTYYVVVNLKGQNIKESGNQTWKYEFIGYDQDGVSQKLPMVTSKQLRIGAYLEVHSKGQNVRSWKEVQESEISDLIRMKWKN